MESLSIGSLSIVANQQGYNIYDREEQQTLVAGISSYKNALAIYERLTSLQESAARYFVHTSGQSGVTH